MKFVIGDAIPTEKKPNTFEVTISTMLGDADGYEDVVVGPFAKGQDEELLEGLLATLKEMDDTYPNGGRRSGYSKLVGHLAWFRDEIIETPEIASYFFDDEEKQQELIDYKTRVLKFCKKTNNYPNWPYSEFTDSPNSYDGHKIVFYDENLVAHFVTVEQ
jgi:hypothetical protein